MQTGNGLALGNTGFAGQVENVQVGVGAGFNGSSPSINGQVQFQGAAFTAPGAPQLPTQATMVPVSTQVSGSDVSVFAGAHGVNVSAQPGNIQVAAGPSVAWNGQAQVQSAAIGTPSVSYVQNSSSSSQTPLLAASVPVLGGGATLSVGTQGVTAQPGSIQVAAGLNGSSAPWNGQAQVQGAVVGTPSMSYVQNNSLSSQPPLLTASVPALGGGASLSVGMQGIDATAQPGGVQVNVGTNLQGTSPSWTSQVQVPGATTGVADMSSRSQSPLHVSLLTSSGHILGSDATSSTAAQGLGAQIGIGSEGNKLTICKPRDVNTLTDSEKGTLVSFLS